MPETSELCEPKVLTFTEEKRKETFTAEAYFNRHGQLCDVRFVRSYILPNKDPAKEWLEYNLFSWFASSNNTISGSLENMLTSDLKSDKPTQKVFKKGIKLLKANGIEFPRKRVECPEIYQFHKELLKRHDITHELDGLTWEFYHSMDPEDKRVPPDKPLVDRIVAFVSEGDGDIARVKDLRLIRFSGGGNEWEVTTLSTEAAESHVSYGFGAYGKFCSIDSHKIYEDNDNKFTVRITCPEEPRTVYKAVDATLDDIKYVASFLGPRMDPSVIKVHYPIMDTDIDALVADTSASGSIKSRVKTARKYVDYAPREFPGTEKYLKACLFLVNNRRMLGKTSVKINMGCVTEDDAKTYASMLQEVVDGSVPKCGCGAIREII